MIWFGALLPLHRLGQHTLSLAATDDPLFGNVFEKALEKTHSGENVLENTLEKHTGERH